MVSQEFLLIVSENPSQYKHYDALNGSLYVFYG